MKDLIKKSKTDLEKMLDEKLLSLRDIRFGSAHSKSKNVKEYSSIRKEIARTKTVLKNIE